jgi:hypothetical protein
VSSYLYGTWYPFVKNTLTGQKLGSDWARALVSEYDLNGDDMHLWIATLVVEREDRSKLVKIVPVIECDAVMVILCHKPQ